MDLSRGAKQQGDRACVQGGEIRVASPVSGRGDEAITEEGKRDPKPEDSDAVAFPMAANLLEG
jgi:hypothetical protein